MQHSNLLPVVETSRVIDNDIEKDELLCEKRKMRICFVIACERKGLYDMDKIKIV